MEITVLVIAALLGLIPANIAKNKGYSFGLWWFYGWMLFIVAIIHVNFIPDKRQESPKGSHPSKIPYYPPKTDSVADEIRKYKELLDNGAISNEEYENAKKKLLEGVSS